VRQTNAIIRAVAARPDSIAFLLWGRAAQTKRSLIGERHVVIKSNHPSGLSARRGATPFIKSRSFSRANDDLEALGGAAIDWSLTATG
jgi:uracil-DNA glycosylase